MHVVPTSPPLVLTRCHSTTSPLVWPSALMSGPLLHPAVSVRHVNNSSHLPEQTAAVSILPDTSNRSDALNLS